MVIKPKNYGDLRIGDHIISLFQFTAICSDKYTYLIDPYSIFTIKNIHSSGESISVAHKNNGTVFNFSSFDFKQYFETVYFQGTIPFYICDPNPKKILLDSFYIRKQVNVSDLYWDFYQKIMSYSPKDVSIESGFVELVEINENDIRDIKKKTLSEGRKDVNRFHEIALLNPKIFKIDNNNSITQKTKEDGKTERNPQPNTSGSGSAVAGLPGRKCKVATATGFVGDEICFVKSPARVERVVQKGSVLQPKHY